MGKTIVMRAADKHRVLLALPNGQQWNYQGPAAMRVGHALLALGDSLGGINYFEIDEVPSATVAYEAGPRLPLPEPATGLVLKYATGAEVPLAAKYMHTLVEDQPAVYSQVPGMDTPARRFVWHYFLVPRDREAV